MKKVLAMILVLSFCFSLMAGCASPSPAPAPSAPAPAPSNTPAPSGPDASKWPKLKLVWTHAQSTDSQMNDVALWSKESIDKATQGTVEVVIYPSSSLGVEVDCVQGMKSGTVDGMFVGPNTIANFIPLAGIGELPYIWYGYEHARDVWYSSIGDTIRERMNNELGITTYGIGDCGFRVTTNNIRPIYKPEDVVGLKMRTMTNDVAIALWTQLKANVTPMAVAEVFSACQTGVVDGEENAYVNIVANSFQEVQKYCSNTNHQYNPAYYSISNIFLAKMADDQRAAFVKAFEGGEEAATEIMKKRNDSAIKIMKDAGMEFNEVDMEAFMAACSPVIDKYRDIYGSDVIDQIIELGKPYAK